MTLKEIILTIEKVASAQPAINSIVRQDIYRLNAIPDARYGVFAWLQNEHNALVGRSLITYNFTLFYVDRLTSAGDNMEDVQSAGVATIGNIIDSLNELGIYSDSYTLNTFRQRFEDECAGVYARVSFQVAKDSLCPFDFIERPKKDFNTDYSQDFNAFLVDASFNTDYNKDYNVTIY